jgi:hypothetical protein
MQSLSDGRIRRTPSEWRQIVGRFESRNLSEAASCHRVEFSVSFRMWRARLAGDVAFRRGSGNPQAAAEPFHGGDAARAQAACQPRGVPVRSRRPDRHEPSGARPTADPGGREGLAVLLDRGRGGEGQGSSRAWSRRACCTASIRTGTWSTYFSACDPSAARLRRSHAVSLKEETFTGQALPSSTLAS